MSVSNLTMLAGTWFNELASVMTLTADLATGSLQGQYNSAVGDAKDFYNLTGRFDISPPSGTGVSVGWVVTYRNRLLNAHSTATWSGQYFSGDDGGDERILTQWLLTSSTNQSSVWSSTNIGHDEFTRKKPTAAEIAMARVLTVGSPRPEDILASISL